MEERNGAFSPPLWLRPAAAFLAAAVAISLSVPVSGEDVVDFPVAVARALRNSATVAVSRYDAEAAIHDVEIARSFLLPVLSFEEKYIRSSAPADVFGLKMNRQALSAEDFRDPVSRFNDPAPLGDFITSLSVEQPLFAPKAARAHGMSRREAGARGKDALRTREEAVHRVLSAYLAVLTSKEFILVAERSQEDAREQLRVAVAFEKAGVGPVSDVLRARVGLANADGGVVSAKNRLALAKAALALSMGEKAGASVDASGTPPAMPDPGTLEWRIAQAMERRADLAALSGRVRNASENVDLQRMEFIPTVGLQAGYRVDGGGPLNPDNRSWNVGVGLRWNLFDGWRRDGAVAKAQVEAGRAQAWMRGAEEQAAFQVTGAYLAVDEARQRMDIAQAAVAAAEEGTRLVRARYANQLARMVDLLDAQSALDAARAGAVLAENDLRRARADLEYASGTLLSWAAPGQDDNRRGEGK